MSTNISDLIDPKQAEIAAKILDYYDGEQHEHFCRLLSDPNAGRRDWRTRGIIPRTRNILKMVVDKSGLLFNDKAPKLEVFSGEKQDEQASIALQQELEKVDWIEFFTNFDSVVRMLKTAIVLVQFDSESDQLVLDILTRKNAAVVLNPHNKQVNTLIYRTSGEHDEEQTFRVFTKELIQDIKVDKHGVESIMQTLDNPFKMIPVAVFHDTNTPRTDFWNKIPTDLVQVNDIYNFHLTDSEYAASWSKLKTLFTNCRIVPGDDSGSYAPQETYGQALPHMAPTVGGLIGGPSKVIQLDTTGVENPIFDYKGPEVDLEPIDTMVNKWVSDFAADWAVNVNMAGEGAADSGFKLIVEEMPNLELRKKRARMFEAGFKKLFKAIKTVMDFYKPGTFSDDQELFARFSEPNLPVDKKAQEEVWSRRIGEGRATRVDYFIQEHGMTKEEAEAKVIEIDQAKDSVQGKGVVRTSKDPAK